METFSASLAICAGNSPVPGEFPTQRPVTRSFDVFFDLHTNRRLSKQWWGWWFETLSRPLWRHRNDLEPSWNVYILVDQWSAPHGGQCWDYCSVTPSSLSKRSLSEIRSMVSYKTQVSPLLTHWGYCSLALNHRDVHRWNLEAPKFHMRCIWQRGRK